MNADAVVTRTGVPVAVVEQLPMGFLVTSPCGNPRTIRSGTPLGSIDVVVDPGHGGEPDPGAVGANGLSESEINLRVSRELASILTERGFSVALTRTADYTSPLAVRAAFADHVGAEMMISIHHNAPTANLTSTPGTEVFIQHADPDSRRLGELAYGFVFDALSEFDGMTWSSAPDAGAIEVLNTRGMDAYGMLRTPATVTVLVELAYISHWPEAELMTSSRYVEITAEALADAAVAYLETEETGRGYVATPRVFNPQRGVSGSVCEDPLLD